MVYQMDKAQAIHNFWSGFNIPAYDQNTVPKNAVMPYITYNVATNAMDRLTVLSASLWYYSTSWKDITNKADEIAQEIGYGYVLEPLDNGYLMITQGTPFAQRMSDEDENIRRIYINLNAEFLTAY